MSVEIPSALIRRIQTTLRRNAGVPSSYDPDSNPSLPSLSDAISALDAAAESPISSNSSIRCGTCRRSSGLVRGAQSTICIFCGRDRRRDGVAHSVSFNSTVACRKLLDSLGLDGSEIIELDTKSNDSKKGQDAQHDELALSSILDLELKWPPEKVEAASKDSDKAPVSIQTIKLSGDDLDNFFSDSNNKTTSSVPSINSEELMPNNQTNTEGYISSRSETFGSFEDLQTQGMALSPDNTKAGGDFDDSFADWETGFQSASSQAHAPVVSIEHSKGSVTKGPTSSTTDVAVSAESKSLDLFKDSATAVSAQTPASTFSEHTNVEHKVSNKVDSIEPMDEWGEFSATANLNQDDLWPKTSNQLQSTSETVDIETKDEVQCTTSAGDSWGQDETWSMSNIKAASSKSDDGNDAFDDAFDSWQDFARSNEAPGVSSSSWTQPGNELTYREYDPTLKTEELQDVEFGSFFNSDSSLGALTEQGGPSESASTSKIEKHTDGKSATENPLETEQDFTSFSNGESRDLLNLWTQTTNESTPKQASLIKPVDPQDMEFGTFLHSGFFSGALDGEKGPTEASVVKLEDPISTNSMNKFDNTKHIDDPLEAWKDFTNLEEAPRGLPNTWIPSREASTEHAPGVKSVDPVDSEFGSFVYTYSFSGLDKSSTKVNDIMLDSLVSKPSAEFISGNDMDDNDGLFGSWKDSTSLSKVPAGLPNSLTQPGSKSTSSKPVELKNNNHTDDNDNPFGSWNEATRLHEVPEGLPNLSAQTGTKTTLYEQTSGMKMMDLEDMDFGGFLQSDTFSGVSRQENSSKVNDVQLDAFVSTSSFKEANNTKNVDDDNDRFGGWQDFFGLNEAQRSSGNLLREPDAGAISYGHTSGAKSLDLHDMGFGSFLYSDSSSGALGHKRSNSEVNSIQDASISFRMNGMDEKIGAVSKAAEAHENNIYASNNESTKSNVEMLLAQMPDLSFMLDDKLSIPKKADGSHSNF